MDEDRDIETEDERTKRTKGGGRREKDRRANAGEEANATRNIGGRRKPTE